MFMPHKPGMKFETPESNDGEIEEEKMFEAELESDIEKACVLETNPYLKVHKADIRAFRAFRRTFKLYNRDPEDLDIYVIHPERNVAITRAFRKGDKVPNFHFLTEKRGEAEMLKQKSGIEDVRKGIAEKHKQKSDIVVALDPGVKVTSKMLKNVESGGWFLCKMSMANSVRATGKYKLLGVVDREGDTPTVNKNTEGYWEKAEIESDEDFEKAQGEGAVTYQEALEKVEKAGYSIKNVLESYKRLVEKAKEQNPGAFDRGETLLPCSIEHKGEVIDLGELNTVLPLKTEEQNSENIVVFKKHEYV